MFTTKKTGMTAGKSNALGGGGRFAQMEAKGASPALAAFIGRKMYGKKKMTKMASKGKLGKQWVEKSINSKVSSTLDLIALLDLCKLSNSLLDFSAKYPSETSPADPHDQHGPLFQLA